MKKKQFKVFVSESEVVKEAFELIKSEVALLCEVDLSPITIELSDTPVLPKKWRGCEIPLSLPHLSEQDLRAHRKELVDQQVTAMAEDIAWRIYKNTNGHGIIMVGAILVSRCRKSKSPGLLLYWSKT